MQKQRDRAETKLQRFRSLEEEVALLRHENSELSVAISAVESELISFSTDQRECTVHDEDFSFQNQMWKFYFLPLISLFRISLP